MITKQEIKTEALGWLELTEDPVKPTWAGLWRAIKRGAPGVIFIVMFFVVGMTIRHFFG